MFEVNTAWAIVAVGALVAGASMQSGAEERSGAQVAAPARIDAGSEVGGEKLGGLHERSTDAELRIRFRIEKGASLSWTSADEPGQSQVTWQGDHRQIEGRLVEVGDDTLTIAADDQHASFTVATHSVLVAQRRSRGQGAIRGAALGLLSGAAAGAIAGPLFWDDPCDGDGEDCWRLFSTGDERIITAIALGAVGAAVGLALGVAFPGSHWARVHEIEQGRVLSLDVTPVPRGAAAAVSVSF